jgi:hypothetical protein
MLKLTACEKQKLTLVVNIFLYNGKEKFSSSGSLTVEKEDKWPLQKKKNMVVDLIQPELNISLYQKSSAPLHHTSHHTEMSY